MLNFVQLYSTTVWAILQAGSPLPTAAIGDSLDWKELSAPEITKRVLDRVKPGSIVLFHNAALHTPEALPGIIESLQADGYTLMPVGELIYKGEFTLDHEGRQIPADAPSN